MYASSIISKQMGLQKKKERERKIITINVVKAEYYTLERASDKVNQIKFNIWLRVKYSNLSTEIYRTISKSNIFKLTQRAINSKISAMNTLTQILTQLVYDVLMLRVKFQF